MLGELFRDDKLVQSFRNAYDKVSIINVDLKYRKELCTNVSCYSPISRFDWSHFPCKDAEDSKSASNLYIDIKPAACHQRVQLLYVLF